MKKLTWLSLVLVLVLSIAAVASASIYGGIDAREALKDSFWADKPVGSKILGDIGGDFTAALNATQPIYYVYDWDMNFHALGRVLGQDVRLFAYPGSGASGT